MRRFCTGLFAFGLVIAAAVIFFHGAPRASNQAFKIDYTLYGPGAALPEGGVSATGSNSLCLPYLRRTGIDNASELAADIDAQTGAAAVVSVARYRTVDGGFDTFPPTDFALAAGEEYRVVVNQSLTYTIFGSHDPGASIVLLGGEDPGSASGTNSFCPPYHSPNATASDLRDEVGAAAGDPAVVTSVGRFLRSTDSVQSYTGSSQASNFDLTAGEGYRVVLTRTVDLVPEHR